MSQFDPSKQYGSNLERWILNVFPERQFMVRKGGEARWIKISTAKQVTASLLVAAFVGWTGFTTVEFWTQRAVIIDKDQHINKAQAAYQTLVERVAEYKVRIDETVAELERNHTDSLTLAEKTVTARQDVKALSGKSKKDRVAAEEAVAGLENDLERLNRQRRTIGQQYQSVIDQIDGEVAMMTDRSNNLGGNLAGEDFEFAKLVLQRDLAIRQRDELDARSQELVEQLAEMQNVQMRMFDRFAELTDGSIDDIESMLKVTGLDLNNLLVKTRENAAQGGPFVPATLPDLGDEKLNAKLAALNNRIDRWDSLQWLQRRLPLGAPLMHYQLTSRYGNRRDPFNGRMAMHEGVDLGAPKKSKVYAVSPGTVKFSGHKARYGKVVIIEHGMGFETLYGHLYSTDVKKGQKVDSSTVIGRVGSTGRSTGPHLHYEVRINSKPQNPSKFIKAGHNVFKG